MKRSAGTTLVLLILFAIAWYINADEPGAPQSAPAQQWRTPTDRELARLRTEAGMTAGASELKAMKRAAVVRVVDGDTVELKLAGKTEKARLLNVDTPETVDPRRPVQEYGREASEFTKRMLPEGAAVFVRFDVEERDRYGRLLLHVYLEDGTWLNALLIRAGYAQLLTVSPNVSAAKFFRELQAKAREEQIGLWQIPEYQQKK